MKIDHVKGHLDLLLLGVLSGGARHGYDVIAALRERSGGSLDLTEGSVYPALHRLEAAGALTSTWEPVSGRRRRVYSITAAGRRALGRERREWTMLAAAVDAVAGVRGFVVSPAAQPS